MDSPSHDRIVRSSESADGPYGQTITNGRHTLSADEPADAGGRDTGMDPYELLLAALCACTSMTLRMYARRKEWPLERVEVVARHSERATADQTDLFERIITLTGDLTLEQRARLIDIAERCPVSRTLQRGARVTAVEETFGV